ncbi:unnamed protein product [Absidia cylindrospora]
MSVNTKKSKWESDDSSDESSQRPIKTKRTTTSAKPKVPPKNTTTTTAPSLQWTLPTSTSQRPQTAASAIPSTLTSSPVTSRPSTPVRKLIPPSPSSSLIRLQCCFNPVGQWMYMNG